MQRDPRAYLWDAIRAVELLEAFSMGKSFDDYTSDALLRPTGLLYTRPTPDRGIPQCSDPRVRDDRRRSGVAGSHHKGAGLGEGSQ